MAAAFFRKRWCMNYFHRELCRVVWRPQVALFSSKPWDKKPPRITHFKKPKPQPAVDVAKLLDQLYSQQRPGTAPSAASKAKPAKASFISSTRVSDVPQTSSKTNPTASASSAAATTSAPITVNTAPASPQLTELTQDFTAEAVPPVAEAAESHVSAETIETKVETAAQPLSADVVEETIPAAAAETSIETVIEASVETSPPSVETIEAAAGSAESVIDITVDAAFKESSDSGETGALNASTVETQVKTTLEAPAEIMVEAVEPVVDITIDATTQIESSDSAGILVETSVEPTTDTVESVEPLVSAIEGSQHPIIDVSVDTTPHPEGALEPPLEPLIDVTVEAAAETSIHPQETSEGIAATAAAAAGDAVAQMIDITLIETTIEPPVEVTLPLVESVETGASVAGSAEAPAGEVRTTRIELGVVSISSAPTVEPVIETTVESSVEASVPPVVMAGTATEAAQAEATSSEPEVFEAAAVEPVIETTVESTVDTSSPPVVTAGTAIQAAEAEASEPEVVDAAAVEPVTETIEDLSVEASAPPVVMSGTAKEATPAEEPSSEPEVFEAAAVEPLAVVASSEETKIESGTSGNMKAEEAALESEKMTLESVTLHSVKSSVDSLHSDELLQTKFTLDEEVEKRVQELLVDAERPTPAEASGGAEEEKVEDLNQALSQWSLLSEELQELEGQTDMLVAELVFQIPAAPSAGKEEEVTTAGGEAMTLESLTLSEVEAEVEILESQDLQEASKALEKEAEALVEEEKMEVKVAKEDVVVVVKEDTAEADISTLDSISEAAEAIEAELPVVMEAMLGSELGAQQPPEALQEDPADQEVEIQEVLEAMSLESVTLAEVEASLETLENETLSETATFLETEAEVLAGDTKVEEVMRSEEEENKAEALDTESVTLPEAEDLQTDALMEELLFTVPAGVREAQVQQEEEEPNAPQALDPIQRLFLEKIREYNTLRSSSGGPVEAELQYQRDLSEETAKLQRLYGGGDLSSFPKFTFTEPKMDQDHK